MHNVLIPEQEKEDVDAHNTSKGDSKVDQKSHFVCKPTEISGAEARAVFVGECIFRRLVNYRYHSCESQWQTPSKG